MTAIKTSHEQQLPSIEKNSSMEVPDQKLLPRAVAENGFLKNFQMSHSSTCDGIFFKKLQVFSQDHLFMEYLWATASNRYHLEKF